MGDHGHHLLLKLFGLIAFGDVVEDCYELVALALTRGFLPVCRVLLQFTQ
ncbi:MAG: hypothetical protein BWY75_02348 [bacterium ADurb.Bin425]|nr:MAG: hypothetical protein BWY75_02348 [bacterium ADurb.Bin425]